MTDKLTAGMKSWIKQDYQDIYESPAEYGIADWAKEFGKIVDIIEEDVNAKFEVEIPRGLIEDYWLTSIVSCLVNAMSSEFHTVLSEGSDGYRSPSFSQLARKVAPATSRPDFNCLFHG